MAVIPIRLFPDPVRTAVIATMGLVLRNMVRFGPSRVKSAPLAIASDALCIIF